MSGEAVAAGVQPPDQLGGVPKPGIIGIVLGIVLMVLGPAAGVGVIIWGAVHMADPVTSARAYSATELAHGPVQVSLTGGVEQGLWLTWPLAGLADCQVKDPSGARVDVAFAGFISQSVNGFMLFGTFTPASSGQYAVSCDVTGVDTWSLKVAPPTSTGSFVASLIGGIAGGGIGFLIGLAVLIVSIVRRSDWDKKHRPQMPPQVAYPVYGYPPGAYPAPGAYPGTPAAGPWAPPAPGPGAPPAPGPGSPPAPGSPNG